MHIKIIFDGKSYWLELVGRNGKIMMFSENYETPRNASRAAARLEKALRLPVVKEVRQ